MSTLDELLEHTRLLVAEHGGDYVQPMQAIDWAYGNLACSTNHKPVRECFLKLALERGVSQGEFDRWAADKEWKAR